MWLFSWSQIASSDRPSGNIALRNDKQAYAVREDFNHILSIAGRILQNFRYQSLFLMMTLYASVCHIPQRPRRQTAFFRRSPWHLSVYLETAELKGLYDAATQGAVQRAYEIERMQFEVSVEDTDMNHFLLATESLDRTGNEPR